MNNNPLQKRKPIDTQRVLIEVTYWRAIENSSPVLVRYTGPLNNTIVGDKKIYKTITENLKNLWRYPPRTRKNER